MELENEMTSRGMARFRMQVEQARKKKQATLNPAVNYLMRTQLAPLTAAIKAFVDDATAGKVGRMTKAATFLRLITPEQAAYLTAKVTLDTVALKITATNLSIKIGEAIEDEVRCSYYSGQAPALFSRLIESQQKKGRGRSRHMRKVVIGYMRKKGYEWVGWSKADLLHVGKRCLELFEESTGVIEVEKTHRQTPKVRLTEAMFDWILKRERMTELLHPVLLPCTVPPQPWSGPFKGGYWLDVTVGLRLIQDPDVGGILDPTRRRAETRLIVGQSQPSLLKHMENLRDVPMPDVYEALTTVQETAWRINRRVYNVLNTVWEMDLGIGKLPSKELLQTPPRPDHWPVGDEFTAWLAADDAHVAEFKNWKRAVTKVHDRNATLISKRLQIAQALRTAQTFLDEPAIYFPHVLDFRGRMYPTAGSLSPQAVDPAKAMLTFAEGKPLQFQEAADWLAIHGANVYGYDKVSFEKRVQWVRDHEQDILAVADDPLRHKLWHDADKPWQFLAFCFEWQGYKRDGLSFVSSLPVALDGTCNGLQHFSAMLRDPVGGEAVNLIPSAKPQDIYQRVADVVIRKLQQDKADESLPFERRVQAETWLAYGITRKTTKRPVMILPYGGTQHACRAYTRQHVRERAEEGQPVPFEDKELGKAVTYLSGLIWSSIGDVVIAARVAMKFLQKIARKLGKKNLPAKWVTPIGWHVMQAYHDERVKKIDTTIHGNTYQVVFREADPKLLDAGRQALGISPNFVHSMDGSALMLSVLCTSQSGVRSYAMVHDSYGTVAADTGALAKCLRRAFVEMYEKHDILQEFLDAQRAALPDAKFPAVPEAGTLDIRQVLESDFFFA